VGILWGRGYVKRSIAIIGVGTVGSTIAYSLLKEDIFQELILLDSDELRCAGQVKDLADASAFLPSSPRVFQGNYTEVKNASLVIIAAGKSQRPGESRIDLLAENKKTIADIAHNLSGLRKDALVIVVTNPVDVLTLFLLQQLDIPRKQIIGTGTLFDSFRLKSDLASHLALNPRSIESWVLGEHGDSQVVAWSTTRIQGNPVEQFGITKRMQKEFAEKIRVSAYDIIAAKGATQYGIAETVKELCVFLVKTTRTIVPVSWYHEEYGACMSLPVLLSENGIIQVVPFALSKKELEQLAESASLLRSIQKLL